MLVTDMYVNTVHTGNSWRYVIDILLTYRTGSVFEVSERREPHMYVLTI